MAKIIVTELGYGFDAQDGSPVQPLIVWNEKSKASDKHPEGKPWIKLPKGNSTNRAYFSEDKFLAESVDGEIIVDVKTTAPRVLGATGVKQDVVKYLDETVAAEYSNLVETALAIYKATKGNTKRKKPEEMSREELQAYIDALTNGTKMPTSEGPKSFLDVMSEDEYNRYNEILAIAQETKANTPKAARKPLTDADKAVRADKRKKTEISKAQALLAALMGGNVIATSEEDFAITDEE